MRCVPAFTLCGVDAPAPLNETLARFEELALANDHFEFYVFPHCDTALTRTNNRTERPAEPRGKVVEYANDVLRPTAPSRCSVASVGACRIAFPRSTGS